MNAGLQTWPQLACFAVSLPRVAPIFALFLLIALLLVAGRFARHMPTAAATRSKPAWQYWFWRLYVPVAYVILIAFFAALFVNPDKSMFAWGICVFVLYGPAVIAIMTRYAFGREYSAFGKRRRTPLPDEPPLRTFADSYGTVGGIRATMPLVTWLIYREGLGVKLFLLGDVFLPWEAVDLLELQPGLTSLLAHRCPEIRGPIRLPNLVARAVADVLESRSRGKVIVVAQLAGRWNPLRLFQG